MNITTGTGGWGRPRTGDEIRALRAKIPASRESSSIVHDENLLDHLAWLMDMVEATYPGPGEPQWVTLDVAAVIDWLAVMVVRGRLNDLIAATV